MMKMYTIYMYTIYMYTCDCLYVLYPKTPCTVYIELIMTYLLLIIHSFDPSPLKLIASVTCLALNVARCIFETVM